MTNFRPIDRATPFLLPPSVEDWLPKDHLARFVVDIVDQLDLSALTRQYRGSGSVAYHPGVMLKLAHLRLCRGCLCEPAHRGGNA
jgi:transposase